MKASIIIPAYNAAATLPLVLETLKKQTSADFEVIVVDDASADQTSGISQHYSGGLSLRVFRAPENLGRARARNFGVQQAHGEIILLLDSDFVVVPDYVSIHVGLHASAPRAVGMGSLRYPPHLARKALARYYSSRGGSRLKPGQPLPGKYFLSCLASFPRSLFDEVGGFDPRFKFYGGEDLELGLRFQKAGADMRRLPSAIGYHHHLRPLKEVMITMEKYGQSGIPLVLEKHPEFTRELGLDDLTGGGSPDSLKSLIRRLLMSQLLFGPATEIASVFQNGKLPSSWLTYLHYGAYRRGFQRHLAEIVQS